VAAAVAGFDALGGRWVSTAEAASCTVPPFAPVPELDGTLSTDPPTRQSDATDLGNIVVQVPAAVLRPGSVDDISKMIRFCRRYGIQVATRGQHHTMHGQGLTCGLIIENSALNTIYAIGPGGADLGSGVTWKQLVLRAFPLGLRPRGLTGYTALSLGGTLSVGGCPLSNHQGALVDHVRALEVVTGRGDVVRCSESQQAELFHAMLAGLGQCGVITRVHVDLVPALPMARTYLLHYRHNAPFFADMRTLFDRGELNEVYTVCIPPGLTTFVYEISATIFYDPSTPPNDTDLLRGLNLPPQAAIVRDQRYVDYALSVDTQIDALRVTGWDSLIKPWYDVWLPDTAVDGYVGDVLAHLTPADVGPTGFLLLFMQQRSKLRRPFFRAPPGGVADRVWLFDIATVSALPGPDSAFASAMLARNRMLFDRARALGGTRYPIGALDFTRDDWVAQYGDAWPAFARQAAVRSRSCPHARAGDLLTMTTPCAQQAPVRGTGSS
jgi:FAD/FMN-containing dehydrogenase